MQNTYRFSEPRMLNNEVEDVLRTSVVDEDSLEQWFRKIGVDTKTSVSSEELKKARPKPRGPPSETIIRDMNKKNTNVQKHLRKRILF
ncbi:MAG: hypothetical protein ACUVUS_07790 [Thermoproteota archaeon]